MSISTALSVRVWATAEECEIGVIRFGHDEVIIELESGRIVSSKNSGDFSFEIQNTVSLDEKGRSVIEPIKSKLNVLLKPVLIIQHPYSDLGGQVVEDIFPPSTSGFYGRLLGGKSESIYFIQKVKNSNQFWLTITDSLTSRIYETHLIQPYEAEALSLVDDYRIGQILFGESSENRETTRDEVLSILDSPAPSWQELSKIIGDVSIPNLQMGKTMRDIFTQIVPTTFPEVIREELMAFLAIVVQSKIPSDDPLIYSSRFSSTPILERLVLGHLFYLIDKSEWPSYVKLMILAARGQLEAPKMAVSDSVLSSPWHLYIQKCAELLPSWLNIAVSSAKTLNESGQIVLGLPTTRGTARKSRISWKKRFAEISYGLRVRGYIDSSALGLVELVYLGAAYRWPHRHMKFITRLGGAGGNPPHLQVMLMPLNAAERVRRTLPNVLSVAWSARTSNLDLFDDKTTTWTIPIQRIVDSLEKKSSIRKLMNRFGDKGASEVYSLSREDAKVVDFISEGVNLSFLEIPEYLDNWGLKKRQIRGHLSNLINRKVIRLTYEVRDPKLVTLAIIIQGKNETITSVFSEFLSNTPTSFARINETGDGGIILSRLPEESVHSIASQLTSRGIDQGVNIRCLRPTAFRGYTSNLYQRLLKDDGTWDDDVSAFLSQARSKRKELSESNA
jgi:hypothetical protein